MMNSETRCVSQSSSPPPSPEILRQAIFQLDVPVIFKGLLQNKDREEEWRLFELSNLTKLIDENYREKLPFRVGVNAQTLEPQWDIACPVVSMKMNEFLNKVQDNNSDKWYYFDYKYMNDWFKGKTEILKAVDWRNFGIDKSGEDSTLWIGSKGAHTNCHQDSYGCNLIAQLHGRFVLENDNADKRDIVKQWLLFPPESGTMLKETRVPYEESTIYSRINFFSPSLEDEAYIIQGETGKRLPKLITLFPGDVLLVPTGWWHYVESLDVTVSVNIWLPLDVDYKTRVKEALVKFIMSGLGDGIAAADQTPSTVPTCLRLIEECKKQYCELQEGIAKQDNKRLKSTPWTLQELVTEYPEYILELPDLNKNSLQQLLISKRERFSKNGLHLHDEDNDISKTTPSRRTLEFLIDNLCHSDNIEKLTNSLLSH